MIEFEKYVNNKSEILFMDKIRELSISLYSGIKRKDGVTDYFNHVETVVKTLLDWGVDDIITLSTAYLHDVFEETEITADELKKIIEAIVNDVELLYKESVVENIVVKVNTLTFIVDKNNEYSNYLKATYLKKVSLADDEILFVKLADRLSNVLDFFNGGNVFYSKKYFVRGEILYGEAIERFDFYKCNLKEIEMLKNSAVHCDDDSMNHFKYTIDKSKRFIRVYEKIIDSITEVKLTINNRK